ncbi:unnamed protein product [Didymodactylos carnosus]|uniref:Uncharacterized protein n=1 Tax=Didymodactylos carnosus TaxID=1234261 RepID=A0A8S2PN08_9BILA|nr:unnamed protein product [Didymodactylos carnosus]
MFATEVTAIIEDAVCKKKFDLIKTKQLIFQNLANGESPHAADVKLVENCFIKILTDCARIEFENKFQQSCSKKDFVDKFTRFSDQISTINDLLGFCEAGDYAIQLESYSNLIDELDLAGFIANLKVYVWKNILEKSTNDHAELKVLQCLVAYFQENIISELMHTKLKEFNKNCGSQSRSARYLKQLMNDENIEKNSTRKLRAFLQSIKSLTCNHLSFENQLLQLIQFYLKPVEIKIQTIGARLIIEVVGGIIYMSQELEKIEKLLNDSQKEHVDEFRFIAVHMFEINCDLENSRWHAINIFVKAKNVNISKKCKWDLSGFSSDESHKKAKNGNIDVKDGMDGVDGQSGESSGNVMIIADEIRNSQWLTVILNGGNGANGQDGGDGMNGKDGQGISMNQLKEAFPSPVHLCGRLHDLGAIYKKICSMGQPVISWTKGANSYIELRLANGQEIIHSASRYVSTSCYLLYKGSLGQDGGRGGLNGLSGEGGYHGECIIILKENESFSGKIETTKGKDGQDGKPGQNGEYGKNGWDVGYVDYQGWSNTSEYGENQNQRLRMDYSADNSDRVYCGYRYDVRGSSMYYATIKASALQHRKLTESEKSSEKCTHRKRQKQAVATRKSAMQKRAMTKLYKHHFKNDDHLVKGILQMNTDATISFDMMQRKAKKAFEEVDKLKERSREKVSRYQVYETEMTIRKSAAADTTMKDETNLKQRKSQILKEIKKNIHHDDRILKKLFEEEFSEDELTNIEKQFQTYVTNRQIITPEIRRIQQKFGLTKFQNQLKNDYILPNTNGINQYYDLNIEKYLKIHKESKLGLQQILQYQQENERIKNVFNELLQYRISTENFDTVKKYYDKFISVKIAAQSLAEFLENVDETDEQEFTKTEKLFELKFNQNECKTFLRTLNSLKLDIRQNKNLKHLIPIYRKEVPMDKKKLLKYLLDLYKQMRSTIIANCTLANLVGLLISEHHESQNNSIRIRKY